MKIAIFQMDCRWMDPVANCEAVWEWAQGLEHDVDLLVLPEMFATGFTMDVKGAAQRWEYVVGQMAELAARYDVGVVFSAVVGDSGSGSGSVGGEVCYYNRLFFLTPDGEQHCYDKRHLFRMGGEHLHFCGGADRLIVTFRGVRICPLVCYDLRFPVFSRNVYFYAEGTDTSTVTVTGQVYDVLIYIASWPAVRSGAWSALLRARAIENQCFVVGVNRVGVDDSGMDYSGNSVVLDYLGTAVLEVEAGVAVATDASTAVVDMEALRAYRERFPAYMDADRFRVL